MSRATTPSTFKPKLTTTDWGEEWKELQKARHAADDASYWDGRSKEFGGERGQRPDASPYAQSFIDLAQFQPGETIFDMGCGNGALACPLAQEGHHVIAADFSRGMIAALEKKCATYGIEGIETKLMSWQDDWEKCGVDPACADVAIASRSIVTDDLEKALVKLTRTARRRVCVTLPTGSSPRVDERIFEAIGVQKRLGRDYPYAFMILSNLGYHPEVRYITSNRFDTYDTKQEALEHLGRMVDDVKGRLIDEDDVDQALEKLSAWLDDNLVENEHAGETDDRGIQKRLRLAMPRAITWTFIAWNIEQV